MADMSKTRIMYIDNIRIVLISLIVLLHLAITYGAPGSWYYREVEFESLGMATSVFFILFNATIQAFSLGFFFFISAYFTRASLERKSCGRFAADRLLRLGIPLVFYCVVINPLLIFALWGNGRPLTVFLIDYIKHTKSLGVGPLWFVETLLYFSFAYCIWRRLFSPSSHANGQSAVPGNIAAACYALCVGLVSFIVRIWLPVGWNFELLNLQFPFFSQYIGMFALGIIAHKNNWFERVSDAQGRFWLIIGCVLIATFPVFLVIASNGGGIEAAVGGLHWQSFYYAVWEQFVCVAMVIGLSTLFRRRFNSQGTFAKTLSSSAYGVFIFHAPVIIFFSRMLKPVALHPFVKFLVTAPAALILSFSAAYVIKKLPGAKIIL